MLKHWLLFLTAGFILWLVGCVPATAPVDVIDPARETAITISVVDKGDNPLPEVELLYRVDDGSFVVTRVIEEPTPEVTTTSKTATWEIANCNTPEDVCNTFTALLICDNAYIIEARHPDYEFARDYVTTTVENGRCQPDRAELVVEEIVYAEEPICNAIAVSSVSITVVDEQGIPLSSAQVTFRVNGGNWQATERFEYCPDSKDCKGEFIAGWSQEGSYEIQVEAEGYASATDSVTVPRTANGCNVVTQHSLITLLPDQ
ncbi:hypothetical protein MNBD_CHLOROFLEXI01-2978 [hydrothermal vent metagenome]|uniref:Carboxypeptidase regulatory-like domain-containing protein n=1 Tax=hydrothermal vent metagenome TaxID=652676 RepID=A0A3B0VH85_9ZZZZ